MRNLGLLLLSVLLALPVFATDSDIARRAQRIERLNEQKTRPADLAYAADMRRVYRSGFGGLDDAEHLANQNDEDLKLHWQAVGIAVFYSTDSDVTDAALRVFAELERRGLADDRTAMRIFDALLRARRFDAARDFAARHASAGLPALPDFTDNGTTLPSVWRFNAEGDKAERIGIDLQPLQIIVAAGCHFSADAASDIADDPVLGPVFARHARWLSLPPGSEALDALAEWNRTHPQTPMLAIHDRGEWALLPEWAMPTFAIVKDGRVIDSTKGWRSNDPEFRGKLVALLERAGLLDAGPR